MLLVALAATGAAAVDVEKKLRISLAIGGYNTRDEVGSDAANNLTLTDDNDVPQAFIRDPRNDSAVFGDLTIKPATRATVAVQYALNKIFVLEGSVGYQKDDVGEVEVQAQFPRTPIPAEEDFAFQVYRITAGEMEQIPIQVTALARFRPRANFNPYFGGGIGYIVVGFEPADEFDTLSRNLDNSIGGFAPLQSLTGGIQVLAAPAALGDLTGAHVDARDTFEWHVTGGAELSFKKKWSAFLDLRYIFASRSMSIGFNGAESLGVSVPDKREFFSVLPPESFGAFSITTGGLIDGGQLKPNPGSPPNTDCSTAPQNCTFVLEPDGQLDTGVYYVQGGNVKYGGVSAQIGIRYTF